MTKTMLFASAAIFALTPGVAPASGHHIMPAVRGIQMQPGGIKPCTPPNCTIWDQTGSTTGSAIDSQDFETAFAAYSDIGADDFVVTKKVKVCDIAAVGFQFVNAGNAPGSYEVHFWKDGGTSPNGYDTPAGEVGNGETRPTVIISQPAIGSIGIYDIGLGKLKNGKFKCKGQKLKPGHYWLSVEANCNFSAAPACGEWGWATRPVDTRTSTPAVWANEGGFPGTCSPGDDSGGAIGWDGLPICISTFTSDADFAFGLG